MRKIYYNITILNDYDSNKKCVARARAKRVKQQDVILNLNDIFNMLL